MEHPDKVGAIQYTTWISPILYLHTLYYTPNHLLAVLIYVGILFAFWDGQFWNTLLSLPLSLTLPFISILMALYQDQLPSSLTSSWYFETFVRTTEVSTLPAIIALWPVVLFALSKGINIFDAKFFPFYLLAQWYLLPFNVIFFGSLTLLLFPVTVAALGFTEYYYKPYLQPWFEIMEQ